MNTKNAVIVLPTYNERENIVNILDAILAQEKLINDKNYALSILVVDDSSPDGTATIVKRYATKYSQIHIITGKKQGLGAAYIRGFKYALRQLKADVVFEMDADFSHDPNDIPKLLTGITKGADFVIGSRYIKGGSIPAEWSLLRKANSKIGNIFARYITGLHQIHDCTGGFRAIKASLLKNIHLDQLRVKGYVFQISLLFVAQNKNAKIIEVPIHFKDRVLGKSKIRIKDIIEFVFSSFTLRFPFLSYSFYFVFFGLFTTLIFFYTRSNFFHLKFDITLFITVYSLLMTIQSIFTLFWMLFAWEDPEQIEKDKSPKTYKKPHFSFTAIIPARHEEQVIADTINTASMIEYPENLKEVIVVCRDDDILTIKKAQEKISKLNKSNVRLVTFSDYPINKPHSLNIALQQATKDIVVVFDAEDEPHKDIYQIVNTVALEQKADVVQSGVQLMNYRSRWFSSLNVLEYFFWFKSALHLFAKLGTVPLGGNTVFFKRVWLEKLGGWNESLLTEDADIGIRLSRAGANIKVVYDEQHVTKEETPPTLNSFIMQRTRWNQGFLQILLSGDWLKYKHTYQKILALYILLWAELQAFMFLMLPLTVSIAFSVKLPILVVLLSILPIYLLFLQLLAYIIGLYEFTNGYKLRFPIISPLVILITFYPYQIILGYSALRAIIRQIRKATTWEKTLHINAHREDLSAIANPSTVTI